MSGAPKLVPEPFWVTLCDWNSPLWFAIREVPSPQINTFCAAWQGQPSQWVGDAEWGMREKHYPLNSGPSLQKWCQTAQTYGNQSFREASLLSRSAATQWILIQRLSTKSKGVFSYIPFRGSYRNGLSNLWHTWSHIVSLAILTSGVRWSFFGFNPGDIPQIVFSVVVSLLHSLSLIISLPPPYLHATV
jgi:hypothetical protein